MEYNLLLNILSYSNKYDILTENVIDERSIVVHLAKISYIYSIEKSNILKYNIQANYLNKVIKALSKNYGSKKVIVHKYLGDLENPGSAIIHIKGYMPENYNIFIKTDMSYELKKNSKSKYKKIGPIIVKRNTYNNIIDHNYEFAISTEFKDIDKLIEAIPHIKYSHCYCYNHCKCKYNKKYYYY